MQDVFIIGAKGIGNYGGYETFLKKLIEMDSNNENIKFHVACKFNGQGAMDESKLPGARTVDDHHFEYYSANCFKINVPERLGHAQAIYYDIASLKECVRQIRNNSIQHPIVYVLACRIGPFIRKYTKQIHELGGKVFVNPDGHEWKRAKWSKPVRKYWKISESMMVKNADLLVCDSVNIEKYIHSEYSNFQPNTTFIAYGASTRPSTLSHSDRKVRDWYNKNGVRENEYFLVVGRFVPENNYLTMITEFMKSNVNKDLVLITNVAHNHFYDSLKTQTHFDRDKRIKFVGTVYDSNLLTYIRENAFGYLHGHSVGGTNPSLLEALSCTKLNLLYDIGFNREVAKDTTLYWKLDSGSLSSLLNYTQQLSADDIERFSSKAKERIKNAYSWQLITNKLKLES